MSASPSKPSGFLTFTLHAHLPYVVNHGTWPHGMEWLHEAAAETYLPLLRVFGRLEQDGIALRCNLNLSPILLEQLTHPVFQAEFPRYLKRKILAAREDEAFFSSTGDLQFASTARFWQQFFQEALHDFEALGRNIVSGFRGFAERGHLDVITCGATHGYLPLLGTDESVRGQVRTAVATHLRHLGRAPRGIWVPECGYRPGSFWRYPVAPAGGGERPAPFQRIGVEQALGESGLEFFFVDTHLVEEGHVAASPYGKGQKPRELDALNDPATGPSRVYHPFFVAGSDDHVRPVTAFSRDPQTGLQVWSADFGYPGDEQYLDFHKKRWPGGHRYWRVTGSHVDLSHKDRYEPAAAARRVREHASHFAHLMWQTLHPRFEDDVPPILCSPFDAELFGHWWFEGPLWLEAVARTLHDFDTGIALCTCAEYLEQFPRAGTLAIGEGSWGAEGNNQVWLNPETEWTYAQLYSAELACREICTSGDWNDGGLGERIVRQLCRELLLLESSDWQFLITTGAARDYAELRFSTHRDQFLEIKEIWERFASDGELTSADTERLSRIETRDSIFAEIDPSFWALGARDSVRPGAEPALGEPRASLAVSPVIPPSAAANDASLSQVQKYLPSAES